MFTDVKHTYDDVIPCFCLKYISMAATPLLHTSRGGFSRGFPSRAGDHV